MADYGLSLYGNAIIVNTDFAKDNADAVTGFLRAVAKGWKDVIADPAAGAAGVVERNPAADAALEERRLKLAIDANVVTDYTMANGMGGIDEARMMQAFDQIGENYEYKAKPALSDVFTAEYLPTDGSLMLK